MTTAHRPTWKPAVGRAQEGGWTAGGAASTSISALDVAGHTQLKTRRGPQVIDKKQALKESLLALEQAEAKSNNKKRVLSRAAIDPQIEQEGRQKLLKQTAEVDEEALRQKYDDKDADDDDGGGGGEDSDGWSDVDRDNLDDPNDSDLDASDSDDSDDDDSDSDDEDEEAALQAELAKIRAEREAAKAKAEAEAAAEEEAKLGEAAMIGNPLLAGGGGGGGETSGKMKRRWNDDVVFRNQAKGEPKLKKRFINDTVRNDFHKRFLSKFIR